MFNRSKIAGIRKGLFLFSSVGRQISSAVIAIYFALYNAAISYYSVNRTPTVSNIPPQPQNPFAGYISEAQKENKQLVRNTRIGFFVYCGLMTSLYAACVIGSILAMFVIDFDNATPEDKFGTMFGAVILGGISLPLALLFGSGPFLPRKNWAWIFGIVLIAVGLTSPCCMPVRFHC